MESDVIILILTDMDEERDRALAYIGMSRVGAMLVVLGSKAIKKKGLAGDQDRRVGVGISRLVSGGSRAEPPWYSNGPCLSVEFARKSAGQRVTLVLLDGVDPSRTLWGRSASTDMSDAAENLRRREGRTRRSWIYQTDTSGTHDMNGRQIISSSASAVRSWLSDAGVHGAVWTGIPAKGFDLSDLETVVVDWLRKLSDMGQHSDAEKYIKRAPSAVDTPVRRAIRRELGWHPEPLDPMLFADPASGEPCAE